MKNAMALLRPGRCAAGWPAAAAVLGLCALTGSLTVSLTGCLIGPKYHQPVTQAPAVYKESPTQYASNGPDNGTWTVAQPQDAALSSNWWEIFHDPELNSLEQKLNINNYNIKEFFENYMQARALIAEARSAYFPSASINPAFNRARSSGTLQAATIANTGKTAQIYNAPLDISWAPDVWGRVRNEVRFAQYSAQVSAADLEGERLTEQVSLAQFFYEIRGQDALIDIYTKTVDADRNSLLLTQASYDTGVGDEVSVVEARSTLQAEQSALTNLGILRAQYQHAIAVLLGLQPSEFTIPKRPLLTEPPPIPIGLPSQLLQRRPDVAAAERTMAAANAEIGLADTAFFPTLTLDLSGGYQSSLFSNLFAMPSRIWSIGPSASEFLFEGGLRRATVHQFVAIYNADLDSYRQTVLTAFQQVEDNLAATRLMSKQIQQQRQAVASAQSALDLEMGRYETGVDPYIDVVALQDTLLANQQLLATIQVQEMINAVTLIETLGGGWDLTQLPTPKQVSKSPSKAETRIQQ